MKTTIERRRVSKSKSAQPNRTDGYSHGRKWAEDSAEYLDLQRLWEISNDGYDSPLQAIKLAANQKDELAYSDLVSYLLFNEGEDLDSIPDEYLKGFINGAVEVFHEVSLKI
jgi:hypothetical protein